MPTGQSSQMAKGSPPCLQPGSAASAKESWALRIRVTDKEKATPPWRMSGSGYPKDCPMHLVYGDGVIRIKGQKQQESLPGWCWPMWLWTLPGWWGCG